MSRKIRDAALDTRAARSRLRPNVKPYFRLMEPGLHLGYRRLSSGPGSWVARRYQGAGVYTVINIVTAEGAKIIADDFDDADGHTILSFAQAQAKVKERRAKIAVDAAGPYTVARVMDEYLANIKRTGRPLEGAASVSNAMIKPKLGNIAAENLTTAKLQEWLHEAASRPSRARVAKGEPRKYHPLRTDPDSTRRRQSTANRSFAVLKAALNRAWKAGKITTDSAWRRVEVFHSVAGVRTRHLSVPEAKRLVNACPPDFRKLVQGALATGARYGQLCALKASDFNPAQNTVRLTSRKGRGVEKTYYAILADEGAAFFKEACAGLAGKGHIFKKADGSPWTEGDQLAPMAEACVNAELQPIGFHGLRHTWASLSVMAGMPLIVVARNLGHASTKMVEQHYGHLADSFIAESIRAHAPTFGFER